MTVNRAMVAALLVTGLFSVCLAAQRTPKSILRDQNRRIDESVAPGDTALTVIDRPIGPLMVLAPPDMSLTSWGFDLADAVILARIEGRRGELTSNADWIRSQVVVRPLETFKNEGGEFRRDGTLLLLEEGGELTIKGARVTATVSSERPFAEGQQYLMFLKFDRLTKRFLYSSSWTYHLSDGRFTTLTVPDDPNAEPNKIEMDWSDHVLMELRDLSKKLKTAERAR